MAIHIIKIGLAVVMVIAILLGLTPVINADDSHSGNTDAIINVGVSGEATVDVSVSGPAQLQVKASGPATVSVCTGKECLLQVEAEAPAEVNINKNCDPEFNSYKPNNELEIIPGVLWVQGLSFFNKSDDNRAGRLVVYLLGSKYEL